MTKTFKVELANGERGNLYGVGEYLVYGPGDERRRTWALEPQRDEALARAACADLNAREWHNTGGNGAASQVWQRKGSLGTAIVQVMPYRCLVDIWSQKGELFEEGLPFETLEAAKTYADDLIR